MVMPLSRSSSMLSRTWDCISLLVSSPVISMMRSASVDLPWSMWAIMQTFLMFFWEICAIYLPLFSVFLPKMIPFFYSPRNTISKSSESGSMAFLASS